MADRVFPHNTNVNMGSEIQFTGVDWTKVEKNMSNQKFAQDHTDQIIDLIAKLTHSTPEEVEEVIDGMQNDFGTSDEEKPESFDEDEEMIKSDDAPKEDFGGETDDDDEDDDMGTEEFSGSVVDLDSKRPFTPEDDHKPRFHREEAPEEESIEVFGDHDGPEGGMALKLSNTNKMKKIAFTHPSQISAEAIENAKAKGDIRLVNTILAARKENRIRIAKAIEANMKKEAESSANVKKASSNLTFTAPNEFTKSQRLAFNQAARQNGIPEAYIKAMTPVDETVELLNTKIKEVFSSSISPSTKNTVIKTLIKEAKLSPDSKSEFIDYWNNVLGYQDKDFWPAVAANYSPDGDKTE